MGGMNSAGASFVLTDGPGPGGAQITTKAITGGQSYFCVLKLEFGRDSTTCSLFVGGDESAGADAVMQILPGSLDRFAIISNYP